MTTQIATGLNFQLPADGSAPQWIPVLPKPDAQGQIRGLDGRSWSVKDLPGLVAALNARAAQIPVDINHATHTAAESGGASPSVGWPSAFEIRDGETWARIDWNEDGLNALQRKHYRFVSPALLYDKTRAVVGLHSISLVNHPNFPMPALNQRQPSTPSDQNNGAALMSIPKSILERLGLQAEASETAVCSAIDQLKNDHQVALNAAKTPDPERFVPKADLDAAVATNAQLKADLDARHQADIEAEVDAAVEAGKIVPASRDHWVAVCRMEGGLEKFQKIVETSPVIGADTALNNRGANQGGKGQPTEADIEVCRLTGRDPATLYADAQ